MVRCIRSFTDSLSGVYSPLKSRSRHSTEKKQHTPYTRPAAQFSFTTWSHLDGNNRGRREER